MGVLFFRFFLVYCSWRAIKFVAKVSKHGVFIIQLSPDFTTKPLFTQTLGPATYAVMEDTGNFVAYNSDSNVMWQSFDYPTDTILPGQTLQSGESLVVPNIDDSRWRISWQSRTHKDGDGIVLNLDSTGHMYLVDQDGTVIKKLTKDKKQKENIGGLETTIYRATLESDGVFRLYEERIGQPTHDDHSVNSVVLWASYCKKCEVLAAIIKVFTPLSPFLLVLIALFVYAIAICYSYLRL
ncbi:hypothetical protein AQUCO_05700055v1 [Aquilegia coerulea]|uniref:Bulb-type lectin domain-containing protein n=1 Tax=Aquilegia coerulea TaxID=218851 RepID=A0A2G5CGX7_AQUCA|nr:hypothetical protein AQUCO_05700055v1 [Aquilegia coerulea]